MQGDELLHPADLALVRYIRLRKAKEDRNYINFEISWLDDFTNSVNMALHDTRIRFGMAILQEWKCISLFALAPSAEPFKLMETLQLTAFFDGEDPWYQLKIIDPEMKLRGEYKFFSISDPNNGLLALLKQEYGNKIDFHEWHSRLMQELATNNAPKEPYMVKWEVTPIPTDHPMYKTCTARFAKFDDAKRIAKERSYSSREVHLYKLKYNRSENGLVMCDMKELWDSRCAMFSSIDEVTDE